MFRKRWMSSGEAGELRLRLDEVPSAAEAEGFRLERVGSHHCGGREETILWVDRAAADPTQALCLQLDLDPSWGAGGHGVLAWGRRRDEVVQAASWLRSLELIDDEVPPPEGALTPAELFDFGLRQVGHAYRPATQAVLSEALSSSEAELREAAARVIGTLQLSTALPELAEALAREEEAPLRALFQEALDCLAGDALDLRWLAEDFEAACASSMADMPEQVVLKVEQPGALAWGGEPPYMGFELRAYPGLPGAALEVHGGPAWLRDALPAGLPESELSLPARLICEPRFSGEAYSALEEAIAAGAELEPLLTAIDDVLSRTQTWPLRPLAERAQSLAPPHQRRCAEFLALPQWLPGLTPTPPALLAGAQALA